MIAVLDILQSIPVLSFLPPVMLAMMALVPGHQLGIELESIHRANCGTQSRTTTGRGRLHLHAR